MPQHYKRYYTTNDNMIEYVFLDDIIKQGNNFDEPTKL